MTRHAIFALLALVGLGALPGGAAADDPPEWYEPEEADRALAPERPEPPPAPPAPPPIDRSASLEIPVHNYSVGHLKGASTSIRARLDFEQLGVFVGRNGPSGYLELGGSLYPLGGLPLTSVGSVVDLWLLAPTASMSLLSDFASGTKPVLGFGATASGLRATTCRPTCLTADLRLLSMQTMMVVTDEGARGALGFGGSLSFGLGF